MNKQAAAKRLRGIVFNARGDDLERAQWAFRGMPLEGMQAKYGQSGQTRQTILDGYVQDRAEWGEASAFLEELLKKEGL